MALWASGAAIMGFRGSLGPAPSATCFLDFQWRNKLVNFAFVIAAFLAPPLPVAGFILAAIEPPFALKVLFTAFPSTF